MNGSRIQEAIKNSIIEREREREKKKRKRERERGSRYGNVAAAPCISLSEAVFIGRLQGTPASVLPWSGAGA